MRDAYHMGETLNLLFRRRDNGLFELQVKESWSGRTVSGNFTPPYTSKQLNALQKKLNTLDTSNQELRNIGYRLFQALCGLESIEISRSESAEQSVQALLRSVIQRTLRKRGTVALTLSFGPECDTFVRYPWELLHNGEHFLLAAGVFTLTRALVRPDTPLGCELPVLPPLRMLYIGASPTDCEPLETERSFQALERGLANLIESGQLFLDRLEPPTFDELVRYLNSYGGVGVLDDRDTTRPCYAIHFDGHGAYGRLCTADDCDTLNEADARSCAKCGSSLSRVKAQTYLCFCDEQGRNRYIDTQSLRDLLLSSDVRLAVFSACETATVLENNSHQKQHSPAVDATLATALVTAQVPAVVAMPFSLQDDLSPTFMYHFYEALADRRTLEEALSRARQAMLPMHQKSWFIPVLYRHVADGQEGPVPFLSGGDTPEDNDHFLTLPGATATFVGREQEIQAIEALLSLAIRGEGHDIELGQKSDLLTHQPKLRPGAHHIALTGPAGIGKSALAFEVLRRNRNKFPGGVIGISLPGGKSFSECLTEMAHQLHLGSKTLHTADLSHRTRHILGTLRSLASRELPSLLLIDGFDEVKEHAELVIWHQFLAALPNEVIVLVTSRSNPTAGAVLEGTPYRWHEYSIGKMADTDLLKLFVELAAASGLDERIHMEDPRQQAVLREICLLLDGYPLGAELIFGTAHSIGGKLYTPEAATRSLEEVRDELRNTPLAGIWAVLDVSYRRLSPLARLLLSYLAAFKLPFSREQIVLLVAPKTLATAHMGVSDAHSRAEHRSEANSAEEGMLAELELHWPDARDELVQASFMQFDGRVYTIHPQVRNFALSYLPVEERRRVHRVAAAYYRSLSQPGADEWFVAFEHLENAGEPQDLQEAVRLVVRASWALGGRGHASQLLTILRRAEGHALRLGDKTGEGQIQCCLGAILRQLGKYAEAVGCLTRSLALHREQHERYEAGWALYELAMLAREEGNFLQAGVYAQEALQLFREVGDPVGETWMQMVKGEVSRGSGAYYEALGHFELALASFRNLHNDEGVAWTLRDRGTVYEALGKYSKALTDYEAALRLFNALGLRSGQAWVLVDQGVVALDQGKLEQAEQLCREAIAIFHEQGLRRGEGWTLRAMGDIARERRQSMDARGYYADAIAIFSGLGDRVDQARVLNGLGTISFDDGEFLQAKEYYEQAQGIAHEQGARQLDGRALRGLGDVARVLRHYTDAESYYQQAAKIALELDTPAERCAVLRRQGILCQAQERYTEALDYWVQALALDQRLGHQARKDLQAQVDMLVSQQHLTETYTTLCKKYGLG